MAGLPLVDAARAAWTQRNATVHACAIAVGVNLPEGPTLRWRIEAPAPFEAPAAKASRPDEGSWSERDGSVA